MPITHEIVGRTPQGAPIRRYRLSGAHGVEAQILTYGGTLTSLRAPDRSGAQGEVLLGFDTAEPYLGNHPFFGSLVGRYGNRIANGRFELDGTTYALARNDGDNHLHGGPGGFHTRVWADDATESSDGPRLTLAYTSPDGEEGYPGALDVQVVYTLHNDGALQIDYTAICDRTTVLNLTNHAYFNLAGHGTILDHLMTIAASHFLPTNERLIPLGELRSVAGTPMDFMTARRIGDRIDADDPQLRLAGGYDHCWVLDKPPGALGLAARVEDPSSGRLLEAYTTQPGVQFYAGCQLDGSLTGHGGQRYGRYSGLCLETQHFPDSPNQASFPSTVLRPGQTYRQTTIYRLGIA